MSTTEEKARLSLVTEGDNHQQTWSLDGSKTLTVGRITGNDILLPYSWVSRKHAMIQAEKNGSFSLIDLGSANGTMVNGRRVHTPVNLKDGDLIGIGDTRLLFSQIDALSPSSAAVVAPENEEMTVAFARKETVTILLSDIHDYTRLSEMLGARKISQLLQHWTGRVGSLVEGHGGMVDKFIGDAVMALWTGPNQSGNLHQALKTAMAIETFTRSLNHKIPDLPWPLRTGAALNSGEAMLGNLSQEGQQNYTAVGEVVNLTFRLEDHTRPDEGMDLILGSDAAAMLDKPAGFFKQYFFPVKGSQAPLAAWACSFGQLADYLKQ